MDIRGIVKFMTDNAPFIMMTIGFITLILLVMVINLTLTLSKMRSRYKKMMTGVEGNNLEQMLLKQVDNTHKVEDENRKLQDENRRMDDLLQTALTRISVMRFCAFEDMGSDLSYAVAMLDSHNNGVVFSSIFGREDSRSYVKPIADGRSTYTLTKEEEKVLKEAMAKRP